jgi:hypothetical protein
MVKFYLDGRKRTAWVATLTPTPTYMVHSTVVDSTIALKQPHRMAAQLLQHQPKTQPPTRTFCDMARPFSFGKLIRTSRLRSRGRKVF